MTANAGSGPGVLEIGEVLEGVRRDLRAVDAFLNGAVPADTRLVRDVVDHVLAGGGKRLRPALVLLAGETAGGRRGDLIPLAGALELVHTATLIHDDIVDESVTRRGTDTVAWRWGPAVAVLAGDLVFATAFTIISDHGDPRMLGMMSRVISDLSRGEIEQYARRGDLDQTEAIYLDRIAKKTASLMAASSAIGALAAGGSDRIVALMRDYGHNLGMVFQIRDDILDFSGTAVDMGKATAADVSNGVVTLPLIYALSSPGAGPELRRLLAGEPGAATARRISALVIESGGVDHASGVARRYQDLALAALEGLEPVPARVCMERLVEFAASRSS